MESSKRCRSIEFASVGDKKDALVVATVALRMLLSPTPLLPGRRVLPRRCGCCCGPPPPPTIDVVRVYGEDMEDTLGGAASRGRPAFVDVAALSGSSGRLPRCKSVRGDEDAPRCVGGNSCGGEASGGCGPRCATPGGAAATSDPLVAAGVRGGDVRIGGGGGGCTLERDCCDGEPVGKDDTRYSTGEQYWSLSVISMGTVLVLGCGGAAEEDGSSEELCRSAFAAVLRR